MKDEYDFSNAKRGPVVTAPPGKTRITIRIDEDVLAWFKDQVNLAGGGNYQTLMNQALRERTINRLKKNQLDIIVATDVAARGIDGHILGKDFPCPSCGEIVRKTQCTWVGERPVEVNIAFSFLPITSVLASSKPATRTGSNISTSVSALNMPYNL